MPKTIIFVMCAVVLMAACSFDSSGIGGPVNNNTNNINNTNNVNPCKDVDCGDGICITVDATNYSCECTGNWAGDSCDECKEAYTGDDCDECAGEALLLEDGSCGINHCDASNICNNHGDCLVDLSDGSYSCTCIIGYDDNTDCEVCITGYTEYPVGSGTCVVDSCIDVNCLNGGDCRIDGESSFICDCPLSYAGEFCEDCDVANGYIIRGLACQLSPCHNFDCGHGECVVDATAFTASCECDPDYIGDTFFSPQYCGYALADVLVYQDAVDEIAVQVHSDWGSSYTGAYRITFEGSMTGGHTEPYIAVAVDGWVYVDACMLMTSEVIQMTLQKDPYNQGDVLSPVNEVDPDDKDPHKIIATVDVFGTDVDRFQVNCACSGGSCVLTPLGN